MNDGLCALRWIRAPEFPENRLIEDGGMTVAVAAPRPDNRRVWLRAVRVEDRADRACRDQRQVDERHHCRVDVVESLFHRSQTDQQRRQLSFFVMRVLDRGYR